MLTDWVENDEPQRLEAFDTAEGDEDLVDEEINWYTENVGILSENTDYVETTVMFRALRNNLLKNKRTGKPILFSRTWHKNMELL